MATKEASRKTDFVERLRTSFSTGYDAVLEIIGALWAKEKSIVLDTTQLQTGQVSPSFG